MHVISRLISVILFLVLMGSCGGGKEEVTIPSDILNKEKFSSVLADVLVLEGYKSRIYKSKDSLKLSMRSYYKGVLEKHNIDKISYDRTYLFYSEHPELMYEVFQMAETKFKMKEDQLNVEKKDAKLIDEEMKTADDAKVLEASAMRIDSTRTDSLEDETKDNSVRKKLLNLGKK